jgi:hypothetical protein
MSPFWPICRHVRRTNGAVSASLSHLNRFLFADVESGWIFKNVFTKKEI